MTSIPSSKNTIQFIGTVVTTQNTRPFRFHFQTGQLEMDVYAPQTTTIACRDEDRIEITRRVQEALNCPDATVRMNEYFCDICKNWLAATTQLWSASICLSCSMDRDSEFVERIKP